jgi:hypothetical protein
MCGSADNRGLSPAQQRYRIAPCCGVDRETVCGKAEAIPQAASSTTTAPRVSASACHRLRVALKNLVRISRSKVGGRSLKGRP